MEVFTRQADAAKAVGTARACDTADQIGTGRATFTFNAMLTRNQGLAVSTMRTVRAIQAADTVVAANKTLRVRAKRAVAGTLATGAGNTARICRTLTQLPNQVAKSRFELSQAQLIRSGNH
jgi:hypothetical protein